MATLRVVASREQVSTCLGPEVAILNLTSGMYCTLNRTGARIWEMLSRPVQVDSLVEAIVNEFGIARAQADIDVTRFVTELLELRLVETAP